MPPSFSYLPCLLFSFVFHLSLFLGLHQLSLKTPSSETLQEKVISFVDLKSAPSVPQKQEEDFPDITPEAKPAEAQKRVSVLPPNLSSGSPPDLSESPAPLLKEAPSPFDTPISAPEPPPAPAEPLPESSNPEPEEASQGEFPLPSTPGNGLEETAQEETEDTPSPSETAELNGEAASAQSDLANEPSSGPSEEVGEEEGETEVEGDPDGTPPLSPTHTVRARKKVLPRKKPTKKQVKKVGLLGLLGKKTRGTGSAIRMLRPPVSAGQKTQRSSSEPGASPRSKNKGEKIAKLRSKVLREEQSRLTQRDGSGSKQSSGLRIIQGSDRNYGIISTSVQIKRSRLKTVYNNQLRNSPNLEGNVILEFVVSPAGTVLKCNILTSSLENPAFEEALIKEILQWRFPSVKKGTTTILFPISFFPTG